MAEPSEHRHRVGRWVGEASLLATGGITVAWLAEPLPLRVAGASLAAVALLLVAHHLFVTRHLAIRIDSEGLTLVRGSESCRIPWSSLTDVRLLARGEVALTVIGPVEAPSRSSADASDWLFRDPRYSADSIRFRPAAYGIGAGVFFDHARQSSSGQSILYGDAAAVAAAHSDTIAELAEEARRGTRPESKARAGPYRRTR